MRRSRQLQAALWVVPWAVWVSGYLWAELTAGQAETEAEMEEVVRQPAANEPELASTRLKSPPSQRPAA